MTANYHTHTWRCGHAKGTEEDYIAAAIGRGLKILGFSDHTPHHFPGSYYSNFRMKPEQLADYVQTVLALRDRYTGQLDIHLGMETEYYPKLFPDTVKMLRDGGVDYMLLAIHYLDNEINAPYSGAATTDETLLRRYCHQAMEAMETGLYTYMAHPDLIHFVGDPKIYEKHIRELCRKAKECRLPLEINLLGLGEGRHYPHIPFWPIAAEEGCDVVIGFDAHTPEAMVDFATEERALQLAASCGVHLLETVELRSIR